MPERKLDDYLTIVGKHVIEELRLLAGKLKGKTVQHINSTSVGGGVAEILHRMVPLMNELGVETSWDLIRGGEDFFWVTKAFHNALHGKQTEINSKMYEIFLKYSKMNRDELKIYGDIVFVHDPQPIGLIPLKERIGKKWIWRCHVDTATPNMEVWNFLKVFVDQYDLSVFSAPPFSRELKIKQIMIPPSIDPLSEKNIDLEHEVVQKTLKDYGIDPSRKLITQISRFDYLKDPIGVIEAYKIVKRYMDCQLVLAGGSATDDPEGKEVLAKVKDAASSDKDIHIMELPPASHLEVNALQRGSSVVLQKSLKEGFGLTVTEALWKGKPVVAGAVGGIPLQVMHNITGMLVHSVEGAASAIRYLLSNPDFAEKLGQNGKEHVRRNFLLTRHLKDYLLLFLYLDHIGETFIRL